MCQSLPSTFWAILKLIWETFLLLLLLLVVVVGETFAKLASTVWVDQPFWTSFSLKRPSIPYLLRSQSTTTTTTAAATFLRPTHQTEFQFDFGHRRTNVLLLLVHEDWFALKPIFSGQNSIWKQKGRLKNKILYLFRLNDRDKTN